MKEKTKTALLIITCITALVVMSIWIWDDVIENLEQPWVDRYDSSYGR